MKWIVLSSELVVVVVVVVKSEYRVLGKNLPAQK